MDAKNQIEFLHKAINNQRSALKFQIILAIVVLILGIVFIAIVHILSGKQIPQNLQWLLTLGGGFISSLSGFPIKEIFIRKDKISSFNFLLNEFRINNKNKEANAIERLQEQFWKIIEKST